MRKRVMFLGLLLFVAATAISLLSSHYYSFKPLFEVTSKAQSQVGQTPPRGSGDLNPLERVNKAAGKATSKEAGLKASGDEAGIQELFGSISELISLDQQPPIDLQPSIDRLTRAELRFREGLHRKIGEADLVRAINNLTARLALPEFARTSIPQVRSLRVDLMPVIPGLIGKVDETSHLTANREVGGTLTGDMSPAEAVCVAAYLIQQKLAGDLYQTAPGEWSEKLQQVRQSRITEMASRNSDPAPTGLLQVRADSSRSEAIRTSLSRRTLSLGKTGLAQAVDAFWDDLGIQP